jgi:hypothetical protein
VAKSGTSLGTGSLSGRFIESLFRLKNPNPVASTDKAARFCSGLKAAGGNCIIQKS